MNRWASRLLTVLLVLLLLSGCAALQALEEIQSQDRADNSPIHDNIDPQLPTDGEEPSDSGGLSDSGDSSDSRDPSLLERPEEVQEPGADPLDFADEAALRAVLAGEWIYFADEDALWAVLAGAGIDCLPDSDDPSAWITFSEDGAFRMQVKSPLDGTIWEDAGFCRLERLVVGEDEVPDMMALTLSETAADGYVDRPLDSVGDFLLWRKTLCDGEVILSLLQVNNGDSTFSVCFNDWAPILRRYTGWTSQGEIRKGETFCGAAWKVDYETQTVWLDDITEDGRNIGRYEALPYQAAPQLDLYSLPDWSLENGAVWMVRTDAMGRIEEMQPYFNGTCEQLTEEEAAELLCEVYEVQEYLNMGMKMFFDGTRETINDESCVVITLGTDHEESFVRELFYAVAPSGAIYAYDLFNDSWNEVGMG